MKTKISKLINLFSLEEVFCLLYPRLGVPVPGVGHAAVLHAQLLHPDGLPHPVEDPGVGHLGVHLGRPVLTVRQAVAAHPDELLGVVPGHPVHAAPAVTVTRGSLTLEAHLGSPDLDPAPAVAPLPLALLLADDGHPELLEDPGRGLPLTARCLPPAHHSGPGVGVALHSRVWHTHGPQLAGLQLRGHLEPEQGYVVLVAVVVVLRVCVNFRHAVRLPKVVKILGPLAASHHHAEVLCTVLDFIIRH